MRCTGNRCQDVTSGLPSFMQGTDMGWHRRAAQFTDMDEPDPLSSSRKIPHNVDQSFPTPSGITQTTATHRCQGAIHTSQLFSYCQHLQLYHDVLDDCLVDIMYSDNFDMMESAVAAFTAGCEFHLAQDPKNYITNVSGRRVLKPEFSQICSESCLRHGRCEQGVCVCHKNYTGDNCQLQVNVPPTLGRMRGPRYCDLNQRPCRTMWFDAQHFEMNDNFKCRVYKVLPNGKLSGSFVEEKAEFITDLRLACQIPDATNQSVTEFAISVTTDGSHYSNAQHLTVYDSSCMDCGDHGCTQMPDTCLIDDMCYQDNDHKTDDATKICNASASTTQWTSLASAGPKFPEMSSPTISGPDVDFMVTCEVHSTDQESKARFEVEWYVDDVISVGKVTLTGGQRLVSKSLFNLPSTALKIHCMVRSFYEGSTEFSPYMSSLSRPTALTGR